MLGICVAFVAGAAGGRPQMPDIKAKNALGFNLSLSR
jgi:hypothetical protein